MLLPSTSPSSPSSPPTCAWKAQQGSQDGSAALVQQLRGDAPVPGLRDGHGPNEKNARELWAKPKTIAELICILMSTSFTNFEKPGSNMYL